MLACGRASRGVSLTLGVEKMIKKERDRGATSHSAHGHGTCRAHDSVVSAQEL